MSLYMYEYNDGGSDPDETLHRIAAPDRDTADAIAHGLDWTAVAHCTSEATLTPQQAHAGGADIICLRERRFENHYRHCKQEWDDTWSCMCNDRCPVCNKEIEPYDSTEYWT